MRAFRSEIFHQRYTTKVTHYNREIKPIDASAKDVDELQQKKEVSDMLSVLPRQMEEIRASQSVMLAREEMFEKKGSLVQLSVALRGLLRSPRQRGMLRKSLKKVPKNLLKRGVSRKR